ncbi:hypothetical protein L21SP2_1493 [Salinispira pacifica]|uniref:Uncharacterized protein n=1 Tax=Salinispira pacifica TaxID=1307761 RepID=V5WGY0_9SPIO|nr:hypothetical protein L21SP2_1493 [Salinispira pacifica]
MNLQENGYQNNIFFGVSPMNPGTGESRLHLVCYSDYCYSDYVPVPAAASG